MPLSVGERLGPFEILAPLGAGGMGDVYKARDTRLNREVAIKTSKAQFTERFERQGRAVAALNHPNIAQLFDIGAMPNGSGYLVMEYVEGTEPKGPLPVDEVLKIAEQIADALDAAHEKGITHRDLKPANIKIKPDGTVKVLDFGLAKLGQSATPGSGNPETSPTLTMHATEVGMILGTAGYMSPEQARGKHVDRRADIWAFGVVLYELLTGKKLFTGEEVVDILAAIVKSEPDISAAPAQFHKLLHACLQKDPKQRLQAAGDWKLLLSDPLQSRDSHGAGTGADPAPLQSRFGKIAMAAAAVFALAAIALGIGYYRATRPAELKQLVRLDVDLGTGVSLNHPIGADTIISPDGTRLVYVSQGKLFTRRLDQPKAIELAGTEGAYAPFFSPDGQWVAFFAGGKLKKISVEGGAAIALCDAPQPRGGSWGEDGNIIAALVSAGGVLSRIPSAGGTPTALTQLVQGGATQRWPQILPGGKAVLFTAHTTTTGFDTANIEVVSLVDHGVKTLQRGGTFGRYLPGTNGTGHLVYINKGTLFAVPFDPEKLEVRGTPSPVLEEVVYSVQYGSAQFDFSRNGTLVYRSGGSTGLGRFTVQWLDAAGKTQPLLAKADNYLYPRLSPDGTQLALSTADVMVYGWQRDTLTRLTFGGGSVPLWSPDGRYIVFRKVGEGMFWIRSDGAGNPQPLTQSKNQQTPYSFMPDGKRLAYHEQGSTTGFDLWTLPIESDATGLKPGKPEIFLQTQFNERSPFFSPDGHWLAYTSEESGTYQVYVRAFPDNGGKWQISNNGGVYPEFSRDGHELFFRTEDSRMMMAASYTVKGGSFVADKPRVWYDKPIADTGTNGFNYDVAPDGKRIAALMPVETPEAQQSQSNVIFLENFADELQRKVPVK